jgi:hypothetical protein
LGQSNGVRTKLDGSYDVSEKNTLAAASLRWLEFILFVAALALLVPAVPSHEVQKPSVVPALIVGGTLFTASLALTLHCKGDTVFFSALKLMFYFALAWVIHLRVWEF